VGIGRHADRAGVDATKAGELMAVQHVPASPSGICDVLFLVKNGSGFGHIRRAMLLSKELAGLGVPSVVCSQASSLALFGDPGVRVVNFPLLERLKTSAADEVCSALLDSVAARLNPSVLIEDTYPDVRYQSLPSLRGLPRLLVLRRLDPVSFDHLRLRGDLSHYDHILVTQTPEDFHQEPHSAGSRRLVETSGRFTFVGPVFHRPPPELVPGVRRRFAEPHQPLVVVNAGSGGDQLNDAYADRLFGSAVQLARDARRAGIDGRFVLVLGPYYRGRPISAAENIRVVRFEPDLAALLHAATVAMVRPGHNVVHEATSGPAELVLVPGIPWLEGQQEYAHRVGRRVGASVVDLGDYGALRQTVLDALRGTRRRLTDDLPAAGNAAAATAIASHALSLPTGPNPVRPGAFWS
jgi:predicted glycosyltransferase